MVMTTHIVKVVNPPIVADHCHGFIRVFKLIGKEYEFKRMSVGTKIISSSMANYDTAKNKLSAVNFKIYIHECKECSRRGLVSSVSAY